MAIPFSFLAEVLEHFRAEEPKGEIVIVVGGAVVERGEHHNKYRWTLKPLANNRGPEREH